MVPSRADDWLRRVTEPGCALFSAPLFGFLDVTALTVKKLSENKALKTGLPRAMDLCVCNMTGTYFFLWKSTMSPIE